MPWLVGGGVLLALLLGSSKGTAAPVQYAPALPPQPLPVPSLATHLATVIAQPRAVVNVAVPSNVTQSVFTGRPYGSKPMKQDLVWWINHYTGSDYTYGEIAHPVDLADAVHNALHHATLAEVNTLLAFADEIGANASDYVSASADSDEVRQYVLGLQSDAIAPFVAQYAGVQNWPTADPTNLSGSPAETGDRNALHATIAAVKTSGNRQDAMNLGELLDGYVDFGVDWTDAGALLVAFANHPSTMPTAPPPQPGATSFTPTAIHSSHPAARPKPAPAKHPAPPPPAAAPIAHTPPAAPHPADATAATMNATSAPPPAEPAPPAPPSGPVQADVSQGDVGTGGGGPSLGGG